jgi:hypothetical protein
VWRDRGGGVGGTAPERLRVPRLCSVLCRGGVFGAVLAGAHNVILATLATFPIVLADVCSVGNGSQREGGLGEGELVYVIRPSVVQKAVVDAFPDWDNAGLRISEKGGGDETLVASTDDNGRDIENAQEDVGLVEEGLPDRGGEADVDFVLQIVEAQLATDMFTIFDI